MQNSSRINSWIPIWFLEMISGFDFIVMALGLDRTVNWVANISFLRIYSLGDCRITECAIRGQYKNFRTLQFRSWTSHSIFDDQCHQRNDKTDHCSILLHIVFLNILLMPSSSDIRLKLVLLFGFLLFDWEHNVTIQWFCLEVCPCWKPRSFLLPKSVFSWRLYSSLSSPSRMFPFGAPSNVVSLDAVISIWWNFPSASLTYDNKIIIVRLLGPVTPFLADGARWLLFDWRLLSGGWLAGSSFVYCKNIWHHCLNQGCCYPRVIVTIRGFWPQFFLLLQLQWSSSV